MRQSIATTVVAGAVAGWALQLALAAAWAAGAGGYPFVAGDETAFAPLLGQVPSHLVIVGIAAVSAVGLAAGLVGWGVRRRGRAATAAVAALAAAGAIALVTVPDAGLLAALAYTPLLVAGAPFGWPEGATLAQAWPWPVVYQGLVLVGGLASVAAAAVVHRRLRGVCGACGRAHGARGSLDEARVRHVGRWAVGVAVAVPLAYAATRFAWALGIPLGISEAVLAEGREIGLWLRGAGLGALATAGAGLTLGLGQRWGEVVPRWVPSLGGRTIPPALATVPAAIAAVAITAAGIAFVRLAATGAFADFFAGTGWAVIGPELLWPVWGVALALAAGAYHLRRQQPCVPISQ